ncbi:myosin heavy chain-related [Abeliophyllum distichum]|uniref:Myosin heavy chain-related n=1 Tax=Abeliophyllum distichum TaxID=126358 RepID=A0ABD1UH92_9LAMI
MSRIRVSSSPELAASSSTTEQYYDDSALEGVAANVKLLLKLIQDHKDACNKEKKDGRRMLRVATMMTILDNVRTRIKKCQSFGNKSSEAELRRCNTDLKPNHVPRDKRHSEPIADEKERLRKELNASLAARKSLEIMCSSLGKEREIMAAELSRKVHELNGMEELINDFKAQNETLLEKVQECASDHKERGGNEGEMQENIALQERNNVLSEQLLRSLDGYRSMKRKLKEAREEFVGMRSTMDEMGAKVKTSLNRVRSFKERVASTSNPPVDVQEEIIALEHMFECFQMMVAKHEQKKGECLQTKGKINACKPSVLA